MEIHPASYKPTPAFYKMPWENTLYMGVELELEVPHGDKTKTIDKFDDFLTKIRRDKYIYAKSDSSLRNGVELVTHPFTLRYAHEKINFTNIMDYILNKTTFYTGENTGLHVHLSKDFFTLYELKKMRAFFNINFAPYLQMFSLRGGRSGWGKCSDSWRPKDFLHRDMTEVERIDRSNCLAITNNTASTIEIRLFASTVNPDRFKAILQFCDAVSHFIKDVSLATILTDFKSWQQFIKWCSDQNQYFQFLDNYFQIAKGTYEEPRNRVEIREQRR